MSDLKIIDAVKSGNFAEVDRLIKAGAEINQQDEQGWTPLNFAAGNGHLSLAKLLVENGADVFKVGRDQRTAYDIALAAGRASVVKYLREVENQYSGERLPRPKRKYCKAYHLKDLRKYLGWSESRINRKTKKDGSEVDENHYIDDPFPDEKIVFIHENLTVTESMWHNENIIFNQVDSAWEEFCTTILRFKVPDDLDIIEAGS